MMARTQGSEGARTEELIRKTAISLIAIHGFEAMTLRQLAEQVGVQAGSIYRYFPSKGKLLAALQTEHLEFLLSQWQEELSSLQRENDWRGGAPKARVLLQLRCFVAFHIRYHTLRRQEVFVANMELRSLEPGDYKLVVGLRRRYEKILQGILSEGALQGVFRVGLALTRQSEIKVTSFALLAMLTGVGTWFNESGRVAKQDLIRLYTHMVFQSLGVANAPVSSGVQLEHA
jgi:AcrR family transcriptional regulator